MVTTIDTATGLQSPKSVELNNAPSQHDTWLASAASSSTDTSANLNTLNSAYSTQAFPTYGYRINDEKYVLGRYNSNDTSSDSQLFIYNPSTKTDLTAVGTPGIKKPWLLYNIQGSSPLIKDGRAIVVDGQPFRGSNSVGTLDIATNAYVRTVVPSVDLKNSSSHMMSEYGFLNGDTLYMAMLYRNFVENPGIWIIKWNTTTNSFSHLDFTASVQAKVGTAGFDDRVQFIVRGKDSNHIIAGVYSSGVYYVLELEESTQTVVNKINVTAITGESGYYEPLMYHSRLYMIPRRDTGDTTGLKMVKVNLQNFIGTLVTIDEGVEKNTKLQGQDFVNGYSEMPRGETGIFVPRGVTIKGNASEDQILLRLDLETLSFDFISLDGSNFQNTISDTTNDQLRFAGLAGQENGEILGISYWKDESVSDYNSQSLRNGGGMFHIKGAVPVEAQTSGVLADPYIIGAVMYQDDNGNKAFDTDEPESTPTTASGEFTFNTALTAGKEIRIKTQGTHEGITYDTDLAAVVEANGSVAVVSPLTTFTAKGLSSAQLASILNYAATQAPSGAITIGGQAWQIAPEDISTNPLSGDLLSKSFSELQSNPRVLIKLQASLTTYAMLKIFESSPSLSALDGNALYYLGVAGVDDGQGNISDGEGIVAVLARNILQSVTDSLSLTLLTTMEGNLASLRTALTDNGVPNASTVAPTPTVDMVSKVAVSIIERLSTVAQEAANNEVGDDAAKVTAALTAMETFSGTIDSKIMELGMNLYGLKYASTLSPYATPLASGGGNGANIALGIEASGNGATTFRFDGSGNIVAFDANGAVVALP